MKVQSKIQSFFLRKSKERKEKFLWKAFKVLSLKKIVAGDLSSTRVRNIVQFNSISFYKTTISLEVVQREQVMFCSMIENWSIFGHDIKASIFFFRRQLKIIRN